MRQIIGFVSKMITGGREKSRTEEKVAAADRGMALMSAVRAGNGRDVERLLQAPGADATIRDNEGKTLLHRLVAELVKLADPEKSSRYDCLGLLMAKGADINAVDKYGNSPLAEAVKLGDVETVKFLLKNGADANARDKEGKTPLHAFFSVSGPILVRHINREVDLAQIEARIAEMLVHNGADVNALDHQGRTPLAAAAGLCSMNAVAFLLKNGADANARDREGKTPLHMVNMVVGDRSSPGQITKITEMLIQNGADANARDNKQRTPLFFARLDCMVVLLAAGADVNARDGEGKTPIFCVKSQKCLEMLIEKGADPQAVDMAGKRYGS